MKIRQPPPHKFTVLAFVTLTILMFGYFNCNIVSAQENPAVETHGDDHHEEDARFPLLILGGQGGGIVRNEAPGGFLSGELTLNADWVHGNVRATVGVLGNSGDQALFTEFTGYAHLLAIGISDVTYRHYVDGHEMRLLGGFSYTNRVEDIVRVDVNLGPAYFNSMQRGVPLEQFGLQIGSRVTVRFWQLTNTFFINAFQTLSLGEGGIDLSDTMIVCDTSGVLIGDDLVCTFPEPEEDPEAEGGGLVDWLHTGVILKNRTFIWLHEEEDVRMGPELELRFEHMPQRGAHFWAMLSLRAQWQTL